MEESRRRPRPVKVLVGIVATLAGALILGLTRLPAGNGLGIPPVSEADRPVLLGVAALLLVVALWSLATARSGSGRRKGEAVLERFEPFAPLEPEGEAPELAEPEPAAAWVPAAEVPAAAWVPAAEVHAAAWVPAAEVHAAAWVPAAAEAPQPAPVVAAGPPAKVQPVLHRLRSDGWYVGDSIQLSRIAMDHVAVGPAGVLAVQVMSTDASDATGLPLARARVAAEQFQRLLLTRELDIEVVPAMLVWGPNLTRVPGGVTVVDSVAVLSGRQADEWMSELSGKELLDPAKVRAVRDVLAEIVLGGLTDAPAPQAHVAS